MYHLLFVAIPLAAVLLDRSRASTYGLTLQNWRTDLRIGLWLAVPLIALPFVAEGLFGDITVKPGVARNGLVNALVFQFLFVAPSRGYAVPRFPPGRAQPSIRKALQAWGHEIRHGLLVTALLFGFAHLLNPFNPLRASYGLDWVMFCSTTVLALVLVW